MTKTAMMNFRRSTLHLMEICVLILVAVMPPTAPARGMQGLLSLPQGAARVELLHDTDFSGGFRAQGSCDQWSGDDGTAEKLPHGLHLGDCVHYVTPPDGYSVRTLPDPGIPEDAGKYWSLNEGVHKGPFNLSPAIKFPQTHLSAGQDLQIHRMEVNSTVIENSATRLDIESSNETGSGAGLVHGVISNKHGTISLFGDTKNEIRNVATDNGPRWRNDTWPTFYLDQNFKQLIDMGQFSELEFSAKINIPKVSTLSGWTGPYKNATFSIVALLRQKKNPFRGLFIENSLFSRNPLDYQENLGVDQWGQGLYRAEVAEPLVAGAAARRVNIDLIANLHSAKALNQKIGDPQDYYLAAISIGWELTGYHSFKSTIANVSLTGVVR